MRAAPDAHCFRLDAFAIRAASPPETRHAASGPTTPLRKSSTRDDSSRCGASNSGLPTARRASRVARNAVIRPRRHARRLRFRRGHRGTRYTSSGSAPRPRESRPRLCETPPTHCETPPTHCESDLTPWRNGQPCRIVAGRPHQAPQARHRSGVDSSRNRRSLWTVARRSSSLR